MKITCPECSEKFDIASNMVGKKAKCGECGFVFVVPDKGADSSHEPATETLTAKERETRAWLSLYIAGLGVLLLLFRGNYGGMIANMVLAIVIESAAIYLIWRALLLVWPLRQLHPRQESVQMAVLINGILLGIFALSLLLTLYALVSGGSGSGGAGIGGLDQILKSLKDVNKMLPN
jgi:predicted Zn finger-like uncharacterized protein